MAKHELELVELTNMCMIEDKKTNKVLVQIRKKNNWDGISFPGGHVDFAEAIVPSVIREIKEETNLDISNLSPCGIKDWYEYDNKKRYIVFLYKTNSFTGELLEVSDEGKNVWMSIDEIRSSDKIASGFLETLDVFLNKDNNTELFYEIDEDNNWNSFLY